MIPEAKVPCGTCRACCRGGQLVTLTPRDDPQALKAVPYGSGFRVPVLPNGDCIHLGPSGCQVYDARPEVCRAFDCRLALLSRPGLLSGPVRRAAKARLATVPGWALRFTGPPGNKTA